MQTKVARILKSSLLQQAKSNSLPFQASLTTPLLLYSSSKHKPLPHSLNVVPPIKSTTPNEETILFNNPKLAGISSKPPPSEIVDRAIQEAIPKIEAMIAELNPLERECLKKMAIGGMSHGAINYQAHAMLAAGANLSGFFLKAAELPNLLPKDGNYHEAFRKFIEEADLSSYGPKSNSGEGGELAIRDNSLSQSFIRQVASGRFGVNLRYLAYARELQIKINQGAKPGVGGQLPGHKVTAEIAKARYAIPGLSLISPPPHHDIYSIEDLRQLVYDLRSVNPKAKISIKIASLAGCGTIAVGMAKCFPQKFKSDKLDISIAGPGGTGAATLTDKHEINQPWESALAEIHQALVAEGLRERVTLTVSGGIQTGLDSFKAMLLGADNIETGSGALVSLGCVMVRKCHEGDCPTGIATNKQDLIDLKFKGRPEHVSKYLIGLAKSLASQLSKYGFKHPSEAVGRTDLLEVDKGSPLSGLEKLLTVQTYTRPPNFEVYYMPETEAGSSALEYQIIDNIQKGVTYFTPRACNNVLSFGARIGYYQQTKNLLKEPVTVDFKGLANGQSFGFSAPYGLTLIAENANDGTGKALSGAEVFIKGLAGNCLGYGALEGFIAAKECGDRAGIRLSYKARIVVKKLGNNAFNFMTGGMGVILGDQRYYEDLKESFVPKVGNFFREEHVVGPNLGSGFTGGVIILPKILDGEMRKKGFLSKTMLGIKSEPLNSSDLGVLKDSLTKFNKYIPNDPLVTQLLSKGNTELSAYFLKYEPKAQTSAVKQPEEKDPKKTTATATQPPSNNVSFESTNEKSEANCKPPSFSKALSTFNEILNISPQQQPSQNNTKPTPPINIPDPVNVSHEFDSCGVAMLANLQRIPSRMLVENALTMISKFQHRGSIGVDPKTGDGCGIMWFDFQNFFRRKFSHLQQIQNKLFGVIFLAIPLDYPLYESKERFLYHLSLIEGLKIVGNRVVPINNDCLGYMAKQQLYNYKQYIVINEDQDKGVENLELKLMKVRLKFELEFQKEKNKIIPHIFSASSQYLIYKGLFREIYFKDFYLDMQDQDFEASLAISHVRFATNTLPQFKNIQPLARLSNNGENNNLALIERFITEDPFFEEILGLKPDLWTMSDSHILSLFLDYYFLRLYEQGSSKKAFKILRAVMHPYYPNELPNATVSQYYNVFGVPFEGPNASIAFLDQKIALYRDRNGFRPLRGLINKDFVFVGSELGPVDMVGEPFNLPPAEPVFFDMDQKSHEFGFYTETKEEMEGIMSQWELFMRPVNQVSGLKEVVSPRMKTLLSNKFTATDYKLMKMRANWTDELDDLIMKRLFKGEELMSSMADQGPIEALVFGSFIDINGMFKAKFSQVTNPPLAKKEEECFMSLLTFIGKKPSFEDLTEDINNTNSKPNGLLYPSPIIDNVELANIISDTRLKSAEIPTLYPIEGFEDTIKIQLNLIAQSAVSLVRDRKVSLILLTDFQFPENKSEMAPLPPVLVASVVDRALMKAGLRRDVAVVLSSSSLLIGRDIAQAISIGGVDLVNPYLPFLRDPEDTKTSKEVFEKQRDNYRERLKQELVGFMARMGVSSVSAYRGAKIFQGYGLDPDLASLYGVRSEFGGFGLRELAQLIYSNHLSPKSKGFGKYNGQQREFIWKADTAQLAIKALRSTEKKEQQSLFERYETEANILKRGSPRGWLKLVKPTVWSQHNPLPVCVLGAGAAAFYQVSALLETDIPLRITMIERRYVNLFGLVGEGVAPDHPATKKQGSLLQKCLEDDRTEYYGGLEVGTDIAFDKLRIQYPLIIDCRGAYEDIKLGISGESLSQVLPASRVYRAYNGTFDPRSVEDWPFNQLSRNPAIGIIGGGNVSADLARILLSHTSKLEDCPINQNFLARLKEEGPRIINIFIRGGPQDARITMKELEELEAAGFWVNCWYDQSLVPRELDETQTKYYNFYRKFHNNETPNTGLKRLCFYFQHTPGAFQAIGEDVEIIFANQSHRFRLRNVITALGRKPASNIGKGVDYISGWAAGKGGNLKVAESTAKANAEKIVKDFQSNRFKQVEESLRGPENHIWHLRSPVNKQEFLNIVRNVEEKKMVIRTIHDFHLAKTGPASSELKVKKTLDMSQFKDLKSDPENLTIYTGKKVYKIDTKGEESILRTLKKMQNENSEYKATTPNYECDGEGTCGTCGMEVIIKGKEEGLKQTKKEKQLLEINGLTENSILCCQHKMKDMKGFVLFLDKKGGNEQEINQNVP